MGLGCDPVLGFCFSRPASAGQTEVVIRDAEAIPVEFHYEDGGSYFDKARRPGTAVQTM
jgi:hypothetical protein